MRLTKTSAHAALALAFLATRSDDSLTQARQVAEHLGIPTDSALKILQALTRHRLIQSQLGRSGGYRLRKPAEDITLLQVVEAIDGVISAEMPFDRVQNDAHDSVDVLRSMCEQATVTLRNQLSQYTVADLLHSQNVLAVPTG
jgi:Rrf2 family protein